MDYRTFVREVQDFPSPGMPFCDITPLLADARAFSMAIDDMAEPVQTLQLTHVMGLESRGFIFGSALAKKLGLGFVPARKPGKLPGDAYRAEYTNTVGDLNALEIHQDAFKPGDRVLIVDDVLATGATAAAACQLIERSGAKPMALTLFVEMGHLPGRDKLEGLPVFSVLRL
ncbi:MAG TPA: adenine phosphoribosyltransferase [Holophaga sp.]|nr:adenine phosphoribosyltransferase [Holophaga sp.]